MSGSRDGTVFGARPCGLAALWALAILHASCQPAQPVKPAQAERVVPTAEEKRKALDADVVRLVQLARQLKAEVEQTRKDELSVKVLRDADDIDKLARSTRGRLR